MNKLKGNYHYIILSFILILSGFFSFYGSWNEGYSNWYYSSAVKSMLQSYHNFFFVSFDPGGFISVDKPMLGLWLQALSAFIFGFHGWSLILPESIANIISITLLYHLVQRVFGKTAGLISALVLAITPIFEAIGRVNNLDAVLIMTLLFAVWALIIAAERGSILILLFSMFLCGAAYNVKMLEAFMVLPALYSVYLLSSIVSLKKRILHLTVSTVVLITTSLSWSVIVDLTPEDERPYIGGSTTNSLVELALGYNGIHRLLSPKVQKATLNIADIINDTKKYSQNEINNDKNIKSSLNKQGNQEKTGDSGEYQSNLWNSEGTKEQEDIKIVEDKPESEVAKNQADSKTSKESGKIVMSKSQSNNGILKKQSNNEALKGKSDNKMPKEQLSAQETPDTQNIGASGGRQGMFRIFNKELGGQIAWFIPIALFGIIISLLKVNTNNQKDKNTVLRNILLWAMWFSPMYLYFSISSLFHPYYTSILAPSIAALTGIGLTKMWHAYLEKGWEAYILPIAFTVNGIVQGIILLKYTSSEKTLAIVVGGFSLFVSLIMVIIKRININKKIIFTKVLVITEVLVLLISPFIWTCTLITHGFSNKTLPYTGPELPGAPDVVIPQSGYSCLTKYLLNQRQNEKYLAAVPRSVDAGTIILQTGYPVIAYGGFQGTDKVLTIEKLESMVRDGELRYIAINMSRGVQQPEINKWVIEHGKLVPEDEYKKLLEEEGVEADFKVNGSELVLYDLAAEEN